MPISTLAPEILRQCLGHLGQEDLERTSLVCRGWLRPSRDHYWSNVGVNVMDAGAELLASVLGEGTMVPRKINGIEIDESDDLPWRNAEETASWQTNLSNIMGHFSTVSKLTVGCLDISKFPAERRAHVLRPGQAHGALVVQWLKVEHPQEATSFILNQPHIKFLGIGSIVLAQNDKERDDENADAGKRTDKDENGKRTDNDSTAIATPPPSSEHIIRLDKLRHLSLFSDSDGLVWSHLVPLLAKGTFMGLKTLVADCHDRDALVKLISAAAPVLHSLAIAFNDPGIDIDVSKVTSLRNLSVSLTCYPKSKHVLADTVATVLSAPPSLEHVFLNIGPTAIKSEKQLDSGSLQWAALDAVLAGMPQLRRITIIIVLDSCIGMFVGMTGGGGGVVEKWENDALTYIKTRLPGCHAKGLIEVKSVFDSWTSGAFANYPVLE